MATKSGKKPTKKVKTLGAKSLSGDKAKGVRGGGISFAKLGEPTRTDYFLNLSGIKGSP